MTLFEVTALGGFLFGLVGAVLGIVNATRDRRNILVTLQWDMAVTPGDPRYDAARPWGIVKVANVGRRPVYVSHVALRLPKGGPATHLILREGITGERLAEGDPPKIYVVDQSGLEAYAKNWKKVIAQVNDSTGKEWDSRPRRWLRPKLWLRPRLLMAKAKPPSWARPQ